MLGIERFIRLLAAIETRPSHSGNREDDKVCHAKPGECRDNPNHYHYTLGLGDEKSWSLPIATNSCWNKCPYLQKYRRN